MPGISMAPDQGLAGNYFAGLGPGESNIDPEHGAQFGQTPGGANSYGAALSAQGQQFMNQKAPDPNATQFGGAVSADQTAYNQNMGAQQRNLNSLYAQSQGYGFGALNNQIAAGTKQTQDQNTALAHSVLPGQAGAAAARQAQFSNAAATIQSGNTTRQADATAQAQALTEYQNAANAYQQQYLSNQQNQQAYGISIGQMQGQQNASNAQLQQEYQQQAQNAQYAQLGSESNTYAGYSNTSTQQAAALNAAGNAVTGSLISTGIGAVGGGLVGGAAASGAGNAAAQQGNADDTPSDERLKDDIHDQSTMADDFLDHLRPYSFKYKNPVDEPSRGAKGRNYLGVMAQDLESDELGKQLVLDTPRGKVIQQAPSMGAALAGLGRLNEHVKRLRSELDALRG